MKLGGSKISLTVTAQNSERVALILGNGQIISWLWNFPLGQKPHYQHCLTAHGGRVLSAQAQKEILCADTLLEDDFISVHSHRGEKTLYISRLKA